MNAERTRRTRAGRLPEIRLEGDSIAFYLDIAGEPAEQLVIRCTDDGEVMAGIVEARPWGTSRVEQHRAAA